MNKTQKLAKQIVKTALPRMDIPEGILKLTCKDKESFDNAGMARKLGLNNKQDVFEGYKKAVNEYLDKE